MDYRLSMCSVICVPNKCCCPPTYGIKHKSQPTNEIAKIQIISNYNIALQVPMLF